MGKLHFIDDARRKRKKRYISWKTGAIILLSLIVLQNLYIIYTTI